MSFPLASDALQHGRIMIGETVQDLLRWEQYLATDHGVTALDVAGISYGGDLALIYPVFSRRVQRIFASGTLGSLAPIFPQGKNAPAHCIPGVLRHLDRADIAGLNAPRPICAHYGALDTPGPNNASASHNPSAGPAVAELRAVYRAFGAEEQVTLHVTPDRHHEMDNEALLEFLQPGARAGHPRDGHPAR